MFLDLAGGGDVGYAVGGPFGEPAAAGRVGGDGVRPGGAVGEGELGDRAVGGYAAYLAGADLDEPDRAVGAQRDADRGRAFGG
ncbi:hypothetical protein LXN57_27730 [Actinoplanes sp. TRM88002]|uniref:Uncharacterized protein n=1 Tax=Paractinoplanes hotanensis TaxID=2906497 RepID=A0ABT0Y5R4_9ACTN|nr:hypothetical protein [Actinoplanes hotanensis]MCM4081370.1 hypothetical protein [Actinoplanes hotanensis]